MIEALRSSETSVVTRITRRNIPEDGILHSHHRENWEFLQCKLIYDPEILCNNMLARGFMYSCKMMFVEKLNMAVMKGNKLFQSQTKIHTST
jgi:hypothetical protein